MKTQAPPSKPANPGVSTHSVPVPVTDPLPVTKKFTALCVNTGEFNKTLGEIEIPSISTDREIFLKFKETYQALRGFRVGVFRPLLIRPVDIEFIQASQESLKLVLSRLLMLPSLLLKIPTGVDIIPKPPDCTFFASDSDLRSRQYEPHFPTISRAHPPISANSFLHYWQCHSKEKSLQKTKWLNRLPRKLNKKLEDLRRATPTEDNVLGWGILVIEGINKALITLLTLVMVLVSGFIAVSYSIGKDDVSGGFAIGAYIVALWAALVMALYFQWQGE